MLLGWAGLQLGLDLFVAAAVRALQTSEQLALADGLQVQVSVVVLAAKRTGTLLPATSCLTTLTALDVSPTGRTYSQLPGHSKVIAAFMYLPRMQKGDLAKTSKP